MQDPQAGLQVGNGPTFSGTDLTTFVAHSSGGIVSSAMLYWGKDTSTKPASVTASNGLPVSPGNGDFIDHSGTIAMAGLSQPLMAANTARKYFLIQNQSSGDLWINWGSSPVAAAVQPSLQLPSGAVFIQESGFVCRQAVAIFGATLGQAFCAKEG